MIKIVLKFFLVVFFLTGNGILLTEDLSEMQPDLWIYVIIALIIDVYYIYKFVKKAYDKNQEKTVAQRRQREIVQEENRRQEQLRKEEEKKRLDTIKIEQCKKELDRMEREFNGRDCVLNFVCLIEKCSDVNFGTNVRPELVDLKKRRITIENKRDELNLLYAKSCEKESPV